MRKLTAKERLQNWQSCYHVTDWECNQCPKFSKFTTYDEEQAYAQDGDIDNIPIGLCDEHGGLGVICPNEDKRCYCRICELCSGNEKCAIQAGASRFIEELDLLFTHTELEDIPLFKSLILKEILCVIAKRCPYFDHKCKEKP